MEKQSKPMGRRPRTVADKSLMVAGGERLKWVREARGESQAQTAEHIGVHQTSWSLYERGLRWPDEFEVLRLIAKLKISRAYLVEGSLEGVERDLAIQLAARHPELAPPKGKEPRTGTGQS
jgi:transcriptional regulator with XRE-family HTH domain